MRLPTSLRPVWLNVYLLILLCLSSAGLRAQNFNLQTNREAITSLDGQWHFHTGDNPAWASPGFDDSEWPLLRSDKNWAQQGYKGYSGYAWYRFTIQDPTGDQPLSLWLAPIRSSYQVYANGKLIGGFGSMPPKHLILASRPQIYGLPSAYDAGPRIIHIAVRVWQFPVWATYAPGGVLRPGNIAGSSPLLHHRMQIYQAAHSSLEADTYTYSVVTLLFGLLVFGLFLFRPADREYLWFALLLLALAVDAALNIGATASLVSIQVRDGIEGFLLAIFQVAGLLFFARVLRVRRGFWWWLALVAALLEPFTAFFYMLGWTSVAVSGLLEVLCLLPSDIWILAVLTRGVARKDTNARLLLIPVLLVYGFSFADNLAGITFQLGWNVRTSTLNVLLLHSPFPLRLQDVLFTIFAFAMMLFLVRRFSLARREEERLSGELEAARGMQSLLVSVTASHTPSFTVESVYIPASEVGGDFFQVQPDGDGSLLIVIGDVSGKGLMAAMTVSTIIGALRNESSRGPGEILVHLNRVLHGRIGGFVTCCIALVTADGAMVLANAGHLSPYVNGEELAVSGGLPLGMLAEVSYEEMSCNLAPGDRMTFISDGVVEARNTKGELYGFDRTQQISNQTAATIAETARHFGQEDDITVLRIQFVGAKAALIA